MAVALVTQVVRLLLIPLFARIQLARTKQERQAQFQLCSQFLSLWPFRFGMLARRVFYQRTLASCGDNPIIQMGAVFVHPEAVLGNHVLIGTGCVIGMATIGDGVLLANNVSLLSGRRHHRRSDEDVPMRLVKGTLERVTVGEDVWIGANATVMADVGARAIVGAGSVVVKPVAPSTTVAGNPARVIG